MIRLIHILLLLALAGCGYHVPGQEGSLPEGVEVIYPPPFTNLTKKPLLENGLTDSIAEVLTRIPNVRLASTEKAADAVVEGTILGYDTVAISYDQNDAIGEYEARMLVDIKLRQVVDGRLLWQGRLSWKEPYRTNTDKSVQSDLEDRAIREINRRLSEEFLFRLLADF